MSYDRFSEPRADPRMDNRSGPPLESRPASVGTRTPTLENRQLEGRPIDLRFSKEPPSLHHPHPSSRIPSPAVTTSTPETRMQVYSMEQNRHEQEVPKDSMKEDPPVSSEASHNSFSADRASQNPAKSDENSEQSK